MLRRSGNDDEPGSADDFAPQGSEEEKHKKPKGHKRSDSEAPPVEEMAAALRKAREAPPAPAKKQEGGILRRLGLRNPKKETSATQPQESAVQRGLRAMQKAVLRKSEEADPSGDTSVASFSESMPEGKQTVVDLEATLKQQNPNRVYARWDTLSARERDTLVAKFGLTVEEEERSEEEKTYPIESLYGTLLQYQRAQQEMHRCEEKEHPLKEAELNLKKRELQEKMDRLNLDSCRNVQITDEIVKRMARIEWEMVTEELSRTKVADKSTGERLSKMPETEQQKAMKERYRKKVAEIEKTSFKFLEVAVKQFVDWPNQERIKILENALCEDFDMRSKLGERPEIVEKTARFSAAKMLAHYIKKEAEHEKPNDPSRIHDYIRALTGLYRGSLIDAVWKELKAIAQEKKAIISTTRPSSGDKKSHRRSGSHQGFSTPEPLSLPGSRRPTIGGSGDSPQIFRRMSASLVSPPGDASGTMTPSKSESNLGRSKEESEETSGPLLRRTSGKLQDLENTSEVLLDPEEAEIRSSSGSSRSSRQAERLEVNVKLMVALLPFKERLPNVFPETKGEAWLQDFKFLCLPLEKGEQTKAITEGQAKIIGQHYPTIEAEIEEMLGIMLPRKNTLDPDMMEVIKAMTQFKLALERARKQVDRPVSAEQKSQSLITEAEKETSQSPEEVTWPSEPVVVSAALGTEYLGVPPTRTISKISERGETPEPSEEDIRACYEKLKQAIQEGNSETLRAELTRNSQVLQEALQYQSEDETLTSYAIEMLEQEEPGSETLEAHAEMVVALSVYAAQNKTAEHSVLPLHRMIKEKNAAALWELLEWIKPKDQDSDIVLRNKEKFRDQRNRKGKNIAEHALDQFIESIKIQTERERELRVKLEGAGLSEAELSECREIELKTIESMKRQAEEEQKLSALSLEVVMQQTGNKKVRAYLETLKLSEEELTRCWEIAAKIESEQFIGVLYPLRFETSFEPQAAEPSASPGRERTAQEEREQKEQDLKFSYALDAFSRRGIQKTMESQCKLLEPLQARIREKASLRVRDASKDTKSEVAIGLISRALDPIHIDDVRVMFQEDEEGVSIASCLKEKSLFTSFAQMMKAGTRDPRIIEPATRSLSEPVRKMMACASTLVAQMEGVLEEGERQTLQEKISEVRKNLPLPPIPKAGVIER